MDAVHSYIGEWQKYAVKAVVEAFDGICKAEMQSFGQRSYFYCLLHNIDPTSIPADDSPPEEQHSRTVSSEKEDHGDHY